MSRFGLHGKITTHTGRRDEFVGILLEVAAMMEQVAGCHLYLVHVSATAPDTIWVTEVWESAEAHRASLALDGSQAAIQRARPLIAGPPESIRLLTVGGKGLPRE